MWSLLDFWPNLFMTQVFDLCDFVDSSNSSNEHRAQGANLEAETRGWPTCAEGWRFVATWGQLPPLEGFELLLREMVETCRN